MGNVGAVTGTSGRKRWTVMRSRIFEVICAYCGVSKMATAKRTFCSHRCATKARHLGPSLPRTRRKVQSLSELPDRPPNTRHMDSVRGYVMLIWKIRRNTYLWCYEHQYVAGLPSGRMHVHHKDGNTRNNAIDNLAVVPPHVHSRLHVRWDVVEACRLRDTEGWTFARLAAWAGVKHPPTIIRGIRNYRRELEANP